MIRSIEEISKEVEREATILSNKMRMLQQWYIMGVREVDDETWEPYYGDNIVSFPHVKRKK